MGWSSFATSSTLPSWHQSWRLFHRQSSFWDLPEDALPTIIHSLARSLTVVISTGTRQTPVPPPGPPQHAPT
eukprot:scaffold421287_cov61-Attheya_sp.AAC.6